MEKFTYVPPGEKKNLIYTIEIVLGKNGYVETMAVWQYFYCRFSKAGGSNHSLCFLLNVTDMIYLRIQV